MNHWTSKQIERALVAYHGSPFCYRRWLVVPNVSYGLESHECDLLALSTSGYAHEIEIKVSVSDLKADFKKAHQHQSMGNKTRCLWYAAPLEMMAALLEYCPPHAGLLTVASDHAAARVLRKATPIRGARPYTEAERFQLARLGTMRYWTRRECLELEKEKHDGI